MTAPIGPLSPKAAPGRVPPRARARRVDFAALADRVSGREVTAPAAEPAAAKREQPKLESLLVARFLKEAKVLPDGDARAPLLNQILSDHLIEGGSFDLGWKL